MGQQVEGDVLMITGSVIFDQTPFAYSRHKAIISAYPDILKVEVILVFRTYDSTSEFAHEVFQLVQLPHIHVNGFVWHEVSAHTFVCRVIKPRLQGSNV